MKLSKLSKRKKFSKYHLKKTQKYKYTLSFYLLFYLKKYSNLILVFLIKKVKMKYTFNLYLQYFTIQYTFMCTHNIQAKLFFASLL